MHKKHKFKTKSKKPFFYISSPDTVCYNIAKFEQLLNDN